MSAKPIFVREATGLVREFTWVDGFVLGVAYTTPSASFLVIFNLLTFIWPGANAIITIGLLGSIVLLFPLLTYCFVAATMPRSGGDYMFVSRSLFPALGFSTSFIIMLFISIGGIGAQGWYITNYYLAPTFAALGTLYNNKGLLTFATDVTQPSGTIALGGVLLAIAALVINLAPLTFRKFYRALFAIAFAGYPVLFILAFAFSSHAQFVAAFDSYAMSAGLNTSYAGIVNGARQAGAAIVPSSFTASFGALSFVLWTVSVPHIVTYVSGETKHATKQIPLGMITSLFASTFMIAIAAYFVYSVVGYNFLEAVTYWGNSGAPGYPLPSAPLINFFLAILYPNFAFNIFMVIAASLWSFVIMVGCGMMVSRALFAWAFDRVIPSAFADVSSRFHTPVKANIVGFVGAFVFLVFFTYSFIGTWFNSLTAWTLGFIVVMVSATVLPFTCKNIFEQSPAWVKKRIGGLPIMSVVGALGTISFLMLLDSILSQAAISGVTPESIGVIIGVYLVGFVAYYVARVYRRSEGVNIDLAFRQLPPE